MVLSDGERSWRMRRQERELYGEWETLVGRLPRAREGKNDYREGRVSPKEAVTGPGCRFENGMTSSEKAAIPFHVATVTGSGSQSVAGE